MVSFRVLQNIIPEPKTAFVEIVLLSKDRKFKEIEGVFKKGDK
jgi:hypothetical protein